MNLKPDRKPLLVDVFAETASADFREALLGETLRLVRRRRRFQHMRCAMGMLMVFGLLGVLTWQKKSPPQTVSVSSVTKTIPKNYELISTRLFPASAITTTQPFATGQFVASVATVEMIQTTAGDYRVVNDNELLALFSPRPVALIRMGPDLEELVFINPADVKDSPPN